MYYDQKVSNLNNDVNIMNLNLIEAIKSNAKKAGMYNKVCNKNNKNPWYNYECKRSKKLVVNSLKQCKNKSFAIQGDINNFLEEKKKYKKIILRAKSQFTELKIDTLVNSSNTNEFWKNLKSFRTKKNQINYISLNSWYRYLQSSFPSNVRVDIVLSGIQDSILDSVISMDELNFCLAKCKLGKSPGYDEITNEFLLSLPENWKLYLVVFFNRIFSSADIPDDWAKVLTIMLFKKGDNKDPDNYRPIALINSITKIFTQILHQRILKWCHIKNAIPEFQSGFRAGRGCIDNIFTLSSIIQLQLQKKRGKLFAFFVDFKRAFPSINHSILWQKLDKKGLSTKVIKIIMSLYSKANMSVKIGDSTSMSVDITEGVLQGEVLSPILFALFLADISDFLEKKGIVGVTISCNYDITLLAYADDLVFMANSAVEMKKLLRALHAYCTINHLTLNPKKSKIMVFKKGGPNAVFSFFYGKTKIDVINEYSYLGTNFSRSGLFEKTANNVIARASLASASTISLLGSTKYTISWNRINLLFDSLVSSTISHASPIWSLKYLTLLEKIQCQFFKKILHIPKGTPNYAVRLEISRPQLSVHILKLTLGWLAKLAQIPPIRYPLKCFQKLWAKESNKTNLIKYNWVTLVKEVFFSPINELNVWDNLNNFVKPEITNRIMDKYGIYTYMLDLESVSQSSSLLMYPSLSLNNSNINYLSFNIDFSIKRIFAQCRLLNFYNNRIITKIGVYKLSQMSDCNYCNMENIDLLHMIFVCRKFTRARKDLLTSDGNCNDVTAFLINMLSCPEPLFVKKFVNFIRLILLNCVNEGTVELAVQVA